MTHRPFVTFIIQPGKGSGEGDGRNQAEILPNYPCGRLGYLMG
jgi:hypothetical protein